MPDTDEPLWTVIAGLAGTLSHPQFPKGDLAELRRLRPEIPPAAYWRVLTDRVPARHRSGEAAERAWAVILQGMAIMAPDVHMPRRSLGQALRQLNESTAEPRFWRLLRSRGEQLEDQLRMVCRYLASGSAAMDWTGPAELLLARSEERRDRICRRLARAFYAMPQTEDSEPETSEEDA